MSRYSADPKIRERFLKLPFHIGTSGWHYGHWKGPFYPENMPESKFLSYYLGSFSTVEINNSFYQLPSAKTFRQWKQTVGEDFLFSVKASRYITHMKKLKEPQKSLSKFLAAIENLGNSLGPVLFQLPPRWHVDLQRLETFLEHLPKNRLHTFEFRDKTWFNKDVYELLSQYNAAFCIYEISGETSPEKVTADFVYIRLHGPEEAYQGDYSTSELTRWARKLADWASEGKEIYCYFDNDQAGYAVKNALTLQKIIASQID